MYYAYINPETGETETFDNEADLKKRREEVESEAKIKNIFFMVGSILLLYYLVRK